MFGQLGFPELLIIGIIALLVFGPKKLPEIGSGLGKAIKDFKHAMNDATSEAKPAEKPAEKPAPAQIAENQPK
jgi:sec-independent protein translocase protein TatA